MPLQAKILYLQGNNLFQKRTKFDNAKINICISRLGHKCTAFENIWCLCGEWPVTECRQLLLYYYDENYAVEDVMLLSSSEIPDTPPVNLRRVCSNWRILASLVATWDRRLSISRFWSVTACRSKSAVASTLIPPVVSKITVTYTQFGLLQSA